MKPSILQKLEQLRDRYEEIGYLLSSPEIISNQDKFRTLSKEYSELEDVAAAYTSYEQAQQDLEEAKALASDPDPEMRAMGEEEVESSRERLEALEADIEILLLPKDPDDGRNVIVEVRAGTGGDEAAIFAGDLYRMYTRFAETQGWRSELMTASDGEHGGYKEVIVRISGTDVYSRLKFESGAHRVQRVPETESQGRIHTSACTVAVMPEIEDEAEIDINKADLRIDTFRASGAGGQHVNRTESAVRITHLPTNTVTQCQNDRSQHKNKDQAMKQMKAKLYELELQKRSAESQALEDTKADIGWGSQIRSYVLDDSRIKDLRTGVETRNTQAVLDGS